MCESVDAEQLKINFLNLVAKFSNLKCFVENFEYSKRCNGCQNIVLNDKNAVSKICRTITEVLSVSESILDYVEKGFFKNYGLENMLTNMALEVCKNIKFFLLSSLHTFNAEAANVEKCVCNNHKVLEKTFALYSRALIINKKAVN